MFDEGSIVLKRISLSKFGGDRKLAFKRRLIFDKLYIMADYKSDSSEYGCVRTTIAHLTKKMPIFSAEEVKNAIVALCELGFIHRERASKFNNAGYLIKINHYENLTKFYPQANTERRPNGDLTETESIPNVITNNVITNKNISNEDTPKVVSDTKPKKTRKESKPKIPSKTSAAYLAYKDAIKERHGIELSPQGGADVRSILSKLIDEYGEEKAVTIVKAYVNIKDNFLEQNLHHIKFIGSKINVVLKEAENVKAAEDVPMKWCQYREQMVPKKKILINGETRWI